MGFDTKEKKKKKLNNKIETIKILSKQLKEPERDFEGKEIHLEGSDLVMLSQLKENRYAMKKMQEFFKVSRFNPKYFENRLTLKKAKQLARYNEADYNRPSGV